MENEIQLSDTSRQLFRSVATWMRTFAILMIIFVVILALGAIFLAADKGGTIIKAFAQKGEPGMVDFIKETVGVVTIALIIFVLIFGYASTRLLQSANAFTAISYKAEKEQVLNAFRNLKTYWQFYGITLIIVAVFMIYFIVKMVMFMMQLQN